MSEKTFLLPGAFLVISIGRGDLEAMGFDTKDASDEVMEDIADMMKDGFMDSGAFHDALEAAAQSKGLKSNGTGQRSDD